MSRRGVLRKLFGGSVVAAGALALGERPAAAAAVTCPPGMTVCTATVAGATTQVCRDTNADPDNCGRCGNKCADWQLCRSGVCHVICPIGQHHCGKNTCVDMTSDPNNCGGCGKVCASGVCSNGTCTSSGGGTGGVCTPGATQNCDATCGVGVCRRQGGTQTCTSDGQWGNCVCTPGTPDSGSYCDGLDHNCDGIADTTCPDGMTCSSNGTCVSSCPSGQTLCNGVCTTLSTDVNNCGSCGTACSAPTVCQSAICSEGTCQYPNKAPGTPCGTTTCSNGTLSTFSCNSDGQCAEAQSSCSPYFCNASGNGCATSCSSNIDCVVGYVCSNGVCVAAG